MRRDRETLTFLPDPLVDHSWIELHQHKHLQGTLEICQKIYTTGFLVQKFYTLKFRKL